MISRHGSVGLGVVHVAVPVGLCVTVCVTVGNGGRVDRIRWDARILVARGTEEGPLWYAGGYLGVWGDTLHPACWLSTILGRGSAQAIRTDQSWSI